MSNYRRAYLPGGIYFFTVVTLNRVPVFTNEYRVEALRQAFRKVMAARPFQICNGHSARTPALHLAYAGRRCRLFFPLA